jgi:hypothetical protein
MRDVAYRTRGIQSVGAAVINKSVDSMQCQVLTFS